MMPKKILFVAIFFACCFTNYLYGIPFNYQHYTTEDGLSNDKIKDIFQDSRGFLWICTEEGLNLFDGYSFKVYKNNALDSSSISNNIVTCIAEDHEGRIWVGTQNGLNVLNFRTERFERYYHDPSEKYSITNNHITNIVIDKRGEIWVGTFNGLNKYNQENNNFQHYSINENAAVSMKGNSITAMACDEEGHIWTSEFSDGLFRLNPLSDSIVHYPIDAQEGIIDDIVFSICNNPNGNLWLGLSNGQIIDFNPQTKETTSYSAKLEQPYTKSPIIDMVQSKNVLWFLQGKQLVKFNTNDKKFVSYKHKPSQSESLPMGTPFSIAKTNEGTILIGLEGLLLFHPEKGSFSKYYYKIPKESQNIEQNYARAFCQDKSGNIYIGTFHDGLVIVDPLKQNYTRITNHPAFKQSIIADFHVRENGNIWIATSKGLVLFDPDSHEVLEHYIHDPGVKNSLYHNTVNLVFEDSRNTLWVATQESLDRVFLNDNIIIHHTRLDLNGLSHFKITSIMEDKNGFIWVGTFNGLNKYNPVKDTVTIFKPVPGKYNGLSDSFINFKGLYQDSNDFIWVCTKNGLNKYDPGTNRFKAYYQKDGLLSDNVYGILEDENGYYWTVSTKGVSKINFQDKIFINYTKEDQLNVNTEALMIDESGFIYIGGQHENYYRFHPESIPETPEPSQVYITNLLLNNEPVGIYPHDKSSPIKKNILFVDELVLNYKQSDFSFEFSAFDYLAPKKIKFAYMLEGYHDYWVNVDADRRIASFTNLPSGNYTFKVKAANRDGVWGEEPATIIVKILPPPWKSTWAIVVYVVLFMLMLLLIRMIMMRELKLKNKLKLEHMQREEEQKFDSLKTKFFINVSHELKTPLMLIAGPINQLSNSFENYDGKSSKEMKYCKLIERNVQRLLQLTNQLLDFRKIESGNIKIELYNGNIIDFLHNIIIRFEQIANDKHIKIDFYSEEKEIIGWYDQDKMEKIISNLLVNAIKFTPENGSISVRAKLKNDDVRKIEIEVRDTGIGIPENHVKKIFDRFNQVDNKLTAQQGAGIGLSLASDMAKLCGGNINVDSKLGEGSKFTVEMPIDISNFKDYRVIDKKKPVEINNIDCISEEIYPDWQNLLSQESIPLVNQEKAMILIIEDNKDMQFYLSDILSRYCTITTAANGEMGLKKAFELIPDVIVCDIMMPKKDGFEVVDLLKNDPRTSHIPVLMLTALDSVENKVKGLKTGANDYITKPFVSDLLILKIRNALHHSEKLKEYFNTRIEKYADSSLKKVDLQPSEVTVSGIDEKLIENALEVVEKHMSNPEFNVDSFASQMGMEASTLYKKMMALIGMPPGGFIRDIRMKRATQLLKQNKLSIAEVAYMVGFDNPNYFSKVFRKVNNISPSEYIKKQSS